MNLFKVLIFQIPLKTLNRQTAAIYLYADVGSVDRLRRLLHMLHFVLADYPSTRWMHIKAFFEQHTYVSIETFAGREGFAGNEHSPGKLVLQHTQDINKSCSAWPRSLQVGIGFSHPKHNNTVVPLHQVLHLSHPDIAIYTVGNPKVWSRLSLSLSL